ncbi:ATP-binding protein [Ornithinicoccus halotolerans]|uniref:ATP-binding protein n=1 Tax=Ornithinicoccus halotolerans TaxID=1748220 RepID=UPI001E489E78|nr:ATP-binding protein [Ornithinicoccus halotolerans]
MDSSPAPVAPVPGQPQRRLRRPVEGRVLGGVCAGLAQHLSVHVGFVRVAFVLLLTVPLGLGLVAYALLWAVVPQEEVDGEATTATRPGRTRAGSASPWWLLLAGLTMLVIGLAWWLQVEERVDLQLDVWVPVAVVAVGAAVVWQQLDLSTRRRWRPLDTQRVTQARLRVAAGLALAVVGLVLLASRGRTLADVLDVAMGALVVLAGIGVIAAPYGLQMWRDLQTEQSERARQAERADIAAHLHDSVLQTLALIQRRADHPAAVARLARAQERELRGYLYGGPARRDPGASLAAAVEEAAAEVEDAHGLAIGLVVTGDRPVDEPGRALVLALKEALHNAARHGAPPVSVYVEAGSSRVEAFVRDHGPGFDPAQVPHDRLGVRESIVGRMRRHGGAAEVRRRDPGTEVRLLLPVDHRPEEVPR